jgi:hypothetical protein
MLWKGVRTTVCLYTVGKINTQTGSCRRYSADKVYKRFLRQRHRIVCYGSKSCFTKNYQEITMKKLMLTIASILFVSVMAVNAQVSSDSASVSGQPPVSTEDQANYTRDMEVIQSSEVPASLRSTLQGSEYTGWEEGKVYRNSTTNEYLIVIGEEDAKVYRFDANGSRIEETPADNSGAGSTTTPSGTVTPSTPADSSSTETTPAPATPETTPGTGTTPPTPADK